MSKHDFRPGVTDAGKPRAAEGGFPYPGHGSLEDVRRDRQAQAVINAMRQDGPRQRRVG